MVNSLERIGRGLRYRLPGVFSSAVLKYIAAFLMFVDHSAVVMLRLCRMVEMLAADWNRLVMIYHVMRHIGRFSFPIFCFFIVEGYCYTGSKIKYLRNLILFGIISEIPFEKALFTDEVFLKGQHSNVFFTLALGLISVWVIDFLLTGRYTKMPENVKQIPVWSRGIITIAVVSAVCWTADHFHTDYRYGGVIIIVLFFLFRDYPVLACCAAYAAICWYNKSETWSVPAFLMLMMYNGKRGTQSKYFFYIFYPAHLLLLWIIKMIIIAKIS